MGDPSDSSAELPSLLKNSHISPGPYVPGELFDSRPLDVVHEEMLAASKLFHENVREGAVRVLRRTQLEEAKKRLEQAAAEEERQSERIRIEEERIRVEKQTRDNEVRLRALQATKVEVPPAPPPSPPKPTVAPPTQASTPSTQSQPTPAPSTSVSQQPPAIAAQSAPQQPSPTPLQPPQTVQQPIPPKTNGLGLGNHTTTTPPQLQPQVSPAPPQSQPAAPKKQDVAVLPSHIFPQSDRYLVIHQNMKELRRHMKEEGKKNKPFNQKMGQMRRLLGTAIGQLIPIPEGAKKDPNNEVIEKIANTLKEALTTVPSPPMDPGMAMVTTPDPTPGAVHNGDSLPMLFIYLLNILSKAIINQFVIEAGVNPKAANHIGTTTVKIFSKRELLWRGHTMIDILMAKFRIACPVVFGLRGNEKTEEGRARVGWRRNDGDWVSEQEHMTRMTGLGAGYASISLRDFSRSSLTNPYPPYNYWHTLGAILSTPPGHTSSTQYVVLKALIDGYEVKFFEFYGRMALTVLEMALVEFPTRATEAHVAVSSLKVIADKLRRDQGLRFHMETAA